ncbi:hypothetical protein ACFFSW_34330 [Saccharothrix longispora]|uniref:Helix-turn-helix domain-containing protein n=1 Tax=Saccharothrix longispora TaxID=33920 RepID=A0ABU1Q2U9_9PSEU|nr:hypothetical protein [Saccharothrix longispora]MDR6597227.1 hypothetical protein [Saccharothrix longispora]
MNPFDPVPGPNNPFDLPSEGDPYDGPEVEIDPRASLFTLTEVAFLLDLSIGVTTEYLTNGTIPGTQVGGYWFSARTDLKTWWDNLPREGGAW